MENRRKKIFIVGISGFLGSRIAYHLKDNYLISGASFDHYCPEKNMQVYPVSLKNTDLLDALIRAQAPDIIINACGIMDRKFILENEKGAEAINTMLAVSTAVLAYKIKAKYIFLSCSEVYEGKKEKYAESDLEFTLFDVYGKQKISAETYIRTQTIESTILRLGRVLGPGNHHRPNFFDRLRMQLESKDQIEAQGNLTHCYLSSKSFLHAIEQIVAGEFPQKHRVFNIGGPTFTEQKFMQRWLTLHGMDSKKIRGITSQAPLSYGLNSGLFQKTYPNWLEETEGKLLANLLSELSPGVGIKKWQKTLQTQ